MFSMLVPGKTPVPRLSIVIPCVQNSEYFEATLASVLQNRPHDCEVLVVQPRRYDDPYGLKNEVRFVQGPADATMIELINIGIEHSGGEIIHLLACELEVVEGWTQPALRHFHDPAVGCVSPLVMLQGASHHVISRGVDGAGLGVVAGVRKMWRRRRRHPILSPTISAGLYRRQAVLETGGFCADLGVDFADVDMGLSLRDAGYHCVQEDRSRLTTSLAPPHPALCWARGRAAERLFWRHGCGTDARCTLLLRPLGWISEGVANLHRPRVLLQLLGRLQGWCERVVRGPIQRNVLSLRWDQDDRDSTSHELAERSVGHAAPHERRAAA